MWAFCPQKKEDHKGDCQKVFNGNNFITWWKDQLLPNFNQPSAIPLDNAKYHCVHPPNVPKVSKMKKQELQECPHVKLPTGELTSDLTVVELKARERKWIQDNEKIAIVQLAEAQGHTVVFTLPCHSDFQPIELVWALIKGNVGRQCSIDSTLADVYERLMREFNNLNTPGARESINKMINKCAAKAKEFYDEMGGEEDNNSGDDDGFGDESGDCSSVHN